LEKALFIWFFET